MNGPIDLLVFSGVRAVDPARSLDAVVDLVVERGRVTRLGPGAATAEIRAAEGARVLEGRGLLLVPAFLAPHAPLREPGHEYKEDIRTALAAAAAGGFAHVCAMPNTRPVNDSRAVTEALCA